MPWAVRSQYFLGVNDSIVFEMQWGMVLKWQEVHYSGIESHLRSIVFIWRQQELCDVGHPMSGSSHVPCEQHCSLTWGSVWNPLEGVKCSGSIELFSVPRPPTAWPSFLASGTSTKKKKLVQDKWLSVGQWGLRLVSFQYLTPFILQAKHTTW